MKRIMILGGPGSGKSTLARLLAEQTGLPVRHLDHVHWMQNWVERPQQAKLAMVRAFEQEERWIIEGGISTTYPTRLARADTLVWLDLPVSVRFARVLQRSWRYRGQARPDLPAGCIERFDRETASFLWWIWQDRHASRRRVRTALEGAPQHLMQHHLRNARDVDAFLKQIALD